MGDEEEGVWLGGGGAGGVPEESERKKKGWLAGCEGRATRERERERERDRDWRELGKVWGSSAAQLTTLEDS